MRHSFIFRINILEFFKVQTFTQKQKKLKLRPKMSFLGLFKLTFDKTIVIFKISGREIIKMHEFVQNEKKNRILDQKCLFWNLCLPIFKNYCYIWNQRSQITQNPNLFAEIKVLKFETKNTFLGIFRLEFEQIIFIFESRSFKFVKAPIFLWKQNI